MSTSTCAPSSPPLSSNSNNEKIRRRLSSSNNKANGEDSISTSTSTMIDNPCWGGSETKQQDLHYFLNLIDTGYFLAVDQGHVNSQSQSQSHVHENNNGNANSSGNDNKIASLSANDKKAPQSQSAKVQKMIKNNIIIYDDDDYVVLNKPPDLRMDGIHLATVHKLVTYLYPPPSLLQQIEQQKREEEEKEVDKNVACAANDLTKNSATDNNASANDTRLINAVLKLSKHNDLKDNIVRGTHQLDYATSGVLLLAKSKLMASIACRAFEERTTNKEYIALVWGHVNVNANTNRNNKDEEKYPFLNHDQKILLDQWNDGTFEKHFKKERLDLKGGRKKLNTFVGYMPTHSIFGKWKGVRQRRKRKKKRKLELEQLSNENVNTNMDTDTDIDMKLPLVSQVADACEDIQVDEEFWNRSPILTENEEEDLLNCTWKDVKRNPDKKNKHFFDNLAKEYNNMQRKKNDEMIKAQKLREKEEDAAKGIDKKLPTCFRVHGEDDKSFYVQVPLAKGEDSFRETVHPYSLRDELKREKDWNGSTTATNEIAMSQYCATNPDELEFKPSLTKCVVQQLGFWGNHKVTKVVLLPRTGRRHQLRLHMAIIGHAIMGDVTYEPKSFFGDTKMQSESERVSCERMCLHAHKLSLPLKDDERKSFTTPDPFVYINDSSCSNGLGVFQLNKFRAI